jgi:8-amino-7-oxononanoate synthase
VKQVEQWFADALRERASRQLLRRRHGPLTGVAFHANDYLNLASQSGFGARGSRAVVGDSEAVCSLERALADWSGFEDALVLSSGYAANVAALQAVVQPGDRVVSDARNHASIVDGLRLARADVAVVAHLDLSATAAALAARAPGTRGWVVTESYFSMDADSPRLRELSTLCEACEAGLVVDEAHAFGALGPGGRGLCAAEGVTPNVFIGTLGKALGGVGGFVAGSRTLTDLVWNRGRAFVFSTAIGDGTARDLLAAVQRARAADSARSALAENACMMRRALERAGIRCGGVGHIVPVWVGDEGRAARIAEWLLQRGIAIYPMRYPTVALGDARLRLAVSAGLTSDEISSAAALIKEAFACCGS